MSKYQDYYGNTITKLTAFKGYKMMEVSFEYDVTLLNLKHIAGEQIKDTNDMEEFNNLLDELVNLFAHKMIMRKLTIKRWDYMKDIFGRMNDLIGLSEEEMKSKAVEFALDYENKEELMELGIKQIEIMNS